uniref:LRRNT domain-containing protein n=1 Tax=Phlebotomus papatasi TaxID=29031 RepID=A0A1B0DM70_PHLPP
MTQTYQISERAFDGLNNLHTLKLQHNRLIALHNGIFTVVPALNSLNLLDNQLETLTYDNLHPIYGNLLRIDSMLNIDGESFMITMWLPQFGWMLAMIMGCIYQIEGIPGPKIATAKRPKSSPSSQAPTRTPIVPDLCSKAPDMKVICHCSTDARRLVTKADCWVLGSDLSRKDPIWSTFFAHTSITEVKFITFAEGNLTYVPSRAIQILSILSKLSISFTQITEVGAYALSNATHLAKLEFTNNTQLRSLRRFAFANHPVLFDVNLEANHISEIEVQAFVNLPHLEVLRLGYNNITLLPDDVFGTLGVLKHLQMQHNQIAQLSRDIFKGLGNLLSLDISSNNLTFVGNTVFAELWSLQELAMQNNKIE